MDEPRDILSRGTSLEAEMQCIVRGISNIIDRWNALDEYFEKLLAEDFMDPGQYSKLLFDNNSFSRSQKYFWAIGALNEFDTSIADNIKQLSLYFEARIKTELQNPNLAEILDAKCVVRRDNLSSKENGARRLAEFKELAADFETKQLSLVTLQNQFKTRLETVKTLREGLFNASALMESKASTRLGENVKLLTYVSIFYLPLGFCAALWAVPNIEDKATKIPFVITAILVGAVTYFLVFNMDHLKSNFGRFYTPRRDSLVSQMQKEEGFWRQVGWGFEELKPSDESGTPSEWWIPLYAIRQLVRDARRSRRVDAMATTSGAV